MDLKKGLTWGLTFQHLYLQFRLQGFGFKMKKLINAFLYTWAVVMLVLAILPLVTTNKQIEKDKDFITGEMKPIINCIEKLEKIHSDNLKGTLLKNECVPKMNAQIFFDSIPKDDYLSSGIKIKSGSWAIGVWRGEWNEYYIKESNSFLTNNFSWSESIKFSIGAAFIGVIPLIALILIRFFGKRNKR